MLHWYVLQSKPHQERRVAEYLNRRKLEVYLPLIRVNPVNPRSAHECPYFPSYLFAKVDLQVTGLGVLQWTPGLSRFVEFGGQPGNVPESFIYELKRRLEQIHAAGGLTLGGVEHGTLVKITSGPFEGYQAVFDTRLSGVERVRVLLRLIQEYRYGREQVRLIPVELNAGSIEKVKTGRS